jgi:hypothetical protein
VLSASLPHLEIDPGGRVVDAPPAPVRQHWRDIDGRLVATGGRINDAWWMHWAGLGTFWFDDSDRVRAEPVRSGLESTLHDIFLRGVVPVVLLSRGFEALHASAVLHPRGVVALCGTSGRGKSTLALALAETGLQHYADDTIVYRLTGGRPVAVSLPFPVRVDADAQAALREGSAAGTTIEPSSSAPLHRIYHLVRENTLDPHRPQFDVVPPQRGFELLLTHAHPFDMGAPDRHRDFMQNLMGLAAAIEIWECRFAPGLAALPSLAAAIHAHASGE